MNPSQQNADPDIDAMQWSERLGDGHRVHIRPIGPNDLSRERAFLARLSPEARGYRFLGLIKDVDSDVVRELTRVDPDTEVALIALAGGADGPEIGVARYRSSDDGTHCDCAVAVDPAWKRRGVGRLLMRHLIDIARTRGIRRMYAIDAARCADTHRLAEHLGFRSRPDPEDPHVLTFELIIE